jgi:hypothetical protein
MVADIHPAATVGAVAIKDVEFPEGEVGILGPEMRHEIGLAADWTWFGATVKLSQRIREDRQSF